MQIILQFLMFMGAFNNNPLPPPPVHRVQQVYFTPPLGIPLYLAGNYGEIRSAHFHGGLDIKTGQVEGKAVLAADSGYIYRISVHATGYGHALYLRHPNGLITVYGHLRQFVPEVNDWVIQQQYKNKSFDVELNPEPGQFVFRRGQQIAVSGNTGSSGGPHLHFEIRDPSGSVPYNPLTYSFPISDKIRPKITWLAIYPLDDSSSVNGLNKRLLLPVSPVKDRYYLKADNPIVSGRIGFGIETFDYLDGVRNQCEPYEFRMTADSVLHFRAIIDSVPFAQTGYVASFIDYEEKIRGSHTIQKTFVDPNNDLPIFKNTINRGVLAFSDSLKHRISIAVSDAYGNKSVLNFNVTSRPNALPPKDEKKDTGVVAYFRYDSLNVFETPDVRISIPQNTLYKNISFHFESMPTDSAKYSPVYRIDREYVPLKKSFVVSIRPRNLKPSLYDKAMITCKGEKGNITGQGGTYKNGYITNSFKTFGRFYITIDTTPPLIRPVNLAKGARYTNGSLISLRIQDRESGISSYSGYIDKEWVLFEYDPKSSLIFYRVDGSRISRGKNHKLEVIVIDNRENVTRYQTTFYY
jgi:hypothetical protein